MEEKKDELFARTHDGSVFEIPGGRLDQEELDRLLIFCSDLKVSDVTIQSQEPVWADIGGKLERLTTRLISHPEVSGLVRATYGDNGTGMVNSGVPLDYAYEFSRRWEVEKPEPVRYRRGEAAVAAPPPPEDDPVTTRMRFRFNVTCGRMPGGRGFQITARTLPSQPLDIMKLGIEPEILENLRPPQGLNLITGPTGSGKSTLLSSLIRWRCEQKGANEKVVEYSRPIEYVYDRLSFPDSFIHQVDVGDHLRNPDDGPMHQSLWAFCVSNALRRKPKIILIGEARDKETIAGCIMAASTGHLTMSTMHTIGVPDTVARAVMEFTADERRGAALNLLGCLNMVITQLLLPRAGGGVIGCREYMVFDRKARAALVGVNPDEWRDRLAEMMAERRVIGRTMSEASKALLAQGLITPETYEDFAARTSGESKLIRDATGRGVFGRPALPARGE